MGSRPKVFLPVGKIIILDLSSERSLEKTRQKLLPYMDELREGDNGSRFYLIGDISKFDLESNNER